jgi:hypothetical protein
MHNVQKVTDIMDSRLSVGRGQQRGKFCLAENWTTPQGGNSNA